jgi:Cytochrome c oxidase subunit IV
MHVSEEQEQQADKERPAQGEISLRAYTSYWPLLMAIGLFVVLLGVITHPIVLGIGVVIIIVATIGWGLERR